MSKFEKILTKVLRGTSDANIGFDELVSLLIRLGFQSRIRGSHHIFKAKPYQVKQVRSIILKYKIELKE